MHESTTKSKNVCPIVIKDTRINTRKIGKNTYIVSSSFKNGKERDIISTFVRLIQNENAVKPGA